MGMKLICFLIGGFVATTTGSPQVMAQIPTDQEPYETQPVPITEAMIQAGAEAVKNLTPLSPGAKMESYFRLMMGPEMVVGYASAVLKAYKHQDRLIYYYTNTFGLNFPGNEARTVAEVAAWLKPTFEPIKVETRRGQVNMEGDSRSKYHRAEVVGDKIKLTEKYNDEVNTGEVPRPTGTVIFGIESLIQRINLYQHPAFVIREFNAETGKAGELMVTLEKWGDGTPTVVTRWPGGTGSYQFWFDRKYTLIRWGEPSMPMIFVKVSKSLFEETKANFKPVFLPPSEIDLPG